MTLSHPTRLTSHSFTPFTHPILLSPPFSTLLLNPPSHPTLSTLVLNHMTPHPYSIAGKGTAGYGGDNGLSRLSLLNVPTSVCVDDSLRDVTGVVQVYLTDSENNRIRRITYFNQSSTDSSGYPLSHGVISTVIGSNVPFSSFGLDNGGSARKVVPPLHLSQYLSIIPAYLPPPPHCTRYPTSPHLPSSHPYPVP